MIVESVSSHRRIILIKAILKILATLHLTTSKYPEQDCVLDHYTFDYIVVGGGTAGCVVASRLVEDKKTSVLLIEAGGEPRIESDMSALMFYLKSTDGAWNITLQDPGLSLETRKVTNDDMTLGRALGGSSTLSYLQYNTGSRHDYNDWAEIISDSNWLWKNIKPYLEKYQRLEDKILSETDGELYGQVGNIGLTLLRDVDIESRNRYIKMFEEAGHTIVPSINGDTSIGYTDGMYTISNNVRQNTALCYLSNRDKYPNLTILKHTLVKNINFDGKRRACGVSAIICDKRHVHIHARKEVIISAGVVNTPKILMLSGIGPKEELCKHSVHPLSDLPVGLNFQNNLAVPLVFNFTNRIIHYRPFNPFKFPAKVTFSGYVSLNKSNDYPDYQAYTYKGNPKPCIEFLTYNYFYKDSICNQLSKTSVNTDVMVAMVHAQKMRSRGRIVLKSSDYRDNPLVYSGYYSAKDDIENHAIYIQDYIKIRNTDTYKKAGGQLKDPKLRQCGPMNVDDLEYWKCYAQYMKVSNHQYTSTCAMGAVVDSRLRVYGIKRLRVVDASVMPFPPAGGTLGPTIMIGEKAADMIKEDRYK